LETSSEVGSTTGGTIDSREGIVPFAIRFYHSELSRVFKNSSRPRF